MIELRGVGKGYGEQAVLDGVSLFVAPGASIAVTGPSGSGKTTLLNILGLLDQPDSGAVFFDGRDVSSLSDAAAADIRAAGIGFVFQDHHLLPQYSALENVLLPTMSHGARFMRAGAEGRALELLDMVGLNAESKRLPGELSGGERQRVAVARALINRPKIILADEPTGALDAGNTAAIGALLVKLNRELDIALVVVSHAAEIAEMMSQSRTLRGGKLTG